MGFDAGDMPLQCSLKELLAFFTVVASSQISPHTQRAWLVFVIFCAKVIPFLLISYYKRCFFYIFLFFNKTALAFSFLCQVLLEQCGKAFFCRGVYEMGYDLA